MHCHERIGAVDHDLAEIIWITRPAEETIRDQPFSQVKGVVFLGIAHIMKESPHYVDKQRDAKHEGRKLNMPADKQIGSGVISSQRGKNEYQPDQERLFFIESFVAKQIMFDEPQNGIRAVQGEVRVRLHGPVVEQPHKRQNDRRDENFMYVDES